MHVRGWMLLRRKFFGTLVAFAFTGQALVMQLSEADGNTAVKICVGEKLELALSSNPSTGYQWKVAQIDPAVLRSAQTRFVAGGPGLGSGGTEILSFEALRPGQTPVVVVYHRPFETGIAPVRTFQIHVAVTDNCAGK